MKSHVRATGRSNDDDKGKGTIGRGTIGRGEKAFNRWTDRPTIVATKVREKKVQVISLEVQDPNTFSHQCNGERGSLGEC